MSGYFARSGYDECNRKMDYNESIAPGNYYLDPISAVNPSYNDSTSVLCENSNFCTPMSQKNSNISYAYSDIGKRIRLDNALKGLGTHLNKCSVSRPLSKEQMSYVAFNPTIKDRNIFKSNMDVEYNQGFGTSY